MTEEIFVETYKKAYDYIIPDEACIRRIVERQHKKKKMYLWKVVLQPVVAVCMILFLSTVILLPIMAKEIPAVYNIIAVHAPGLADFILPAKVTSTSNGITMQVEAVNIEGENAEIIVSFSDEEGSTENLIKGKVDLYESYNVQSYGAVDNISGCSFIGYNAGEDKAFFKIDATSFEEFDSSKLTFTVYQLLTNCSSEKKDIPLDNIVRNPETKSVVLNGIGGIEVSYSERQGYEVLDLKKADETMADELTITGIAYKDGILRVQSCRGTIDDADRHLQPFAILTDGTTVHEDFSVGWKEQIGNEEFLFDEHCFRVEESELEHIKLFGIFHITDGCVSGNWEVTISLE